nr:hypothetical protein [uncultured Lachnoanaerobaculum sp.]
MKRIFKISVIGLMAVSMLSMNACGKKNSEDFEQKVETTKKVESNYVVDSDTYKEFSVGKVENGIYTNKMFNIKVNGKENQYNFESDDSIKSQFGFNDSDRSDIDSVKEVLDRGDAFVDMYATTPKNKRAVSVMILKSDSDLDTFLEKQLADLDPSLSASKTTVNVLGKEVKGIRYTINGKDSKVYQKLAFIRRGEYVMVIISGGIYAAAPQTGFDSIEILDNQEELENAETKDNSNEVISTAESTETASEDVEVQIGEIENDIYTNKMFGLNFDGKSNDMIFASKEEANKNFYDTGKNESDIKAVTEYLDTGKKFVDMHAVSEKGSVSVMIKKEENIKDTDTYADRAVVGIKKGMERMGMEVETQKGSGEFIGETMPYVTVRATDNGNTAYQKIVFLKVGNYVAEITSYADSEEGASKYIDMFTKLEK